MATVLRPPLFINQRQFPPVLSVTDTSRGSPQTLIGGGLQPFFVAPFFAPDQHPVNEWLPDDTTLSQPITLRAVVAPSPFEVAPHYGPQRFMYQPPDTSAGIPKVLYADSVKPFFVPEFFGPVQHGFNEWLPADTSQGQPATLKVIAPPLTPQPNLPPIRFFWQPADSSSGVPKVLYGDAAVAFSIAPFVAPNAPPGLPANTSQNAYAALYGVVVPLPPGQSQQAIPLRFFWQPPDSSQSTNINLPVPPPVPPPVVLPTSGGVYPDESPDRAWTRAQIKQLRKRIDEEQAKKAQAQHDLLIAERKLKAEQVAVEEAPSKKAEKREAAASAQVARKHQQILAAAAAILKMRERIVAHEIAEQKPAQLSQAQALAMRRRDDDDVATLLLLH